MKKQTSIIVVGGGFAGTTVAKRLAGRLPADVALTLVSEESYTTFNPMLPEAVGASIFPEQVVAPLREIIRPGAMQQFIMGRVKGVDLASRSLHARHWRVTGCCPTTSWCWPLATARAWI